MVSGQGSSICGYLVWKAMHDSRYVEISQHGSCGHLYVRIYRRIDPSCTFAHTVYAHTRPPRASLKARTVPNERTPFGLVINLIIVRSLVFVQSFAVDTTQDLFHPQSVFHPLTTRFPSLESLFCFRQCFSGSMGPSRGRRLAPSVFYGSSQEHAWLGRGTFGFPAFWKSF